MSAPPPPVPPPPPGSQDEQEEEEKEEEEEEEKEENKITEEEKRGYAGYFKKWRFDASATHPNEVQQKSVRDSYPYQLPRTGKFKKPKLPAKRFTGDFDNLKQVYHGNTIGKFRADKTAQGVVRELKASMSLLNLKFEKILGMGGEGVAALFSATTKKKASGKAAEKELFVAKVPINWDPQYKEDLAKERRITARFEGSLHIVQLRHAQAKRRIKFEKGLAKKRKEAAARKKAAVAAAKAKANNAKRKRGNDDDDEEEEDDDEQPVQKKTKTSKGGQVLAKMADVSPGSANTSSLGDVSAISTAPSNLPGPAGEPKDTGNFFLYNKVDRHKPPPSNPQGVVLLEYLGGGTLGHVLRKASDKRMRFPSRVLWIIFDCLIKGLIGLRFPPKRYHKNHDRFDTHNLWAERMPSTGILPQDGGEDHVHFDLDTTNIFLGEIGQTYQGLPNDDHRLFPIAKIADLGVMTHVTPELRASPSSLWWLRTDGKLQHYAPEQFTEEWDFVDQLPDPNVHKTAGKFSWKTNLYQVALIMVALITGFLPQYPPVPKFKTLPAPFFRVATKGKKKPQRSGYTYGSYFLGEPENAPAKGKKWHHVDPDLRNLVAHCMFDQPDKRPSMEELYFYIQGKLKQYQDASNDHGIDEWEGRERTEKRWQFKRHDSSIQPVWTDTKVRIWHNELLNMPRWDPDAEEETDCSGEDSDDDDGNGGGDAARTAGDGADSDEE